MLICRDQRTGTGCGASNRDDAQHCMQCGRPLRFALQLRNPGELVGSYRIVQVIGHGGFGAVYEVVVSRRPSVRVTLKESFDPDSVRAFESEFTILHQLQHDNLPRYHETFESNGHGYLVMELVSGQSLEDIVRKRGGAVLEKLVIHYADQLCNVLSYLHGQEPPIMHRDIKPANVRLTPEGLIKLVDFGLLKQGTETTRNSIPKAGTLAYAPLEQWIGGTDQRSDIYSLGATLYHLLTGQVPPPAASRTGSPTDPLIPPRQTNPRLSQQLSDVVVTAMHVQREHRYPDIETMHDAILQAAQSVRGTTPLMPPPLPQMTAEPQPSGTHITPTFKPRPYPLTTSAHIVGAAPLHTWVAHADTIRALAWSPDGRTLASASDDGKARLWQIGADGTLGSSQVLLSGWGSVYCVAWSPDGARLITGSGDHVVRLWRANDATWLGTWSGHVSSVSAVAWSPDGRTAASSGADKVVRLWNVADGQLLSILSGHLHAINALVWNPNGRTLVSGSVDTTLRLWAVDTGACITALRGHTRSVQGAAWSADGHTIASAGADNSVRLWRASDGFLLAMLYGHTDAVFSVAWSPDALAIASAGGDRVVRLWHTATNDPIAVLDGHTNRITALAWHPDGRTLASAGADRTIRLWRVQYAGAGL